MGRLMRLCVVISISALLGSGCDIPSDEEVPDDEDQEAEELGVAELPFTGALTLGTVAVGSYAWNTTTATSPGWQGFLSAVVGNFAKTSITSPYVNARVYAPDDFTVDAMPSASSTIIGGAGWAVYPGNNNTTAVSCSNADSTPDIKPLPAPPGASNYACFLRTIRNTLGNSFGAFEDQARTYKSGGTWYLSCRGNAEATAQCVPITSTVSAYAFTGPATVSLGLNQPGMVCGLTHVSGVLRTNSGTHGIRAYPNSTSTEWFLTVSAANQGGGAMCVK